MADSIPGNTGKVKDRSYQDLAKENIELLEALRWLYAACALDQLLPESTSMMKNAVKAIAKADAK